MNAGNQDAAMTIASARKSDARMAKAALDQISAAFEVMQTIGQSGSADFLNAQLAERRGSWTGWAAVERGFAAVAGGIESAVGIAPRPSAVREAGATRRSLA